MSVEAKCDIHAHRVLVDETDAVLTDQFAQCVEERAAITTTEYGRVGWCRHHLLLWQKEREDNLRSGWLRMRRGILIAGPTVRLRQKG